jgi:hypothetical protein
VAISFLNNIEHHGVSKQASDNGTESYSTTGVPKMFPTVAA